MQWGAIAALCSHRLDARRLLLLLQAHGTEQRLPIHRLRDAAAALVALGLGLGGRSRVAMA
jgi:hypothetical protein